MNRSVSKGVAKVLCAFFSIPLCLSLGQEVLVGDVNLDGSVNLLDVDPFVDRLSTGDFQAEADTNQDGAVNLLDVQPFIEILSGGNQLGLQNFEVSFFSGALQNDFNIESVAGASFLYAGVPAEFQVQTSLNPSSLGNVTVVGLTAGPSGPPVQTFNQTFEFKENVSPSLILPPNIAGQSTFLYLIDNNGIEIPLLYLRTLNGPITDSETKNRSQWRQEVFGSPTANQNSLNLLFDAGDDGFTTEPEPISNVQQDQPFAGKIGESESFITRFTSDDGEGASWQPVRFQVTDSAVMGLRRSGFPNVSPQPELTILTDENGYAVVQVVYLGEGQSGMTMASQIALKNKVLIAEDLKGGEAIWQVNEDGPTNPLINTIRVTKCIANSGTPDENETPFNQGLSEDSPLLTFGTKYEFCTELSAPLPPNGQIRWCITDANGERQLVDFDGKVCFFTTDPNPNETGDRLQVCVEAKLVVQTHDGLEAISQSEKFDFTVVEKKSITICPNQFGGNVPNDDSWRAIIDAMNEIYNGTGVCFEIGTILNASEEPKELCVCIESMDEEDGKTSRRTLTGSMADCVDNDFTLEGSSGKITIQVGAEIKLKFNGGECEGGYNGSATGAVEVACDGGTLLDYDTENIWVNVICISPGVMNQATGERTISHEVAHILGLPHTSDVEDDNLLHRTGEQTAGTKRNLTSGQAAEIYRRACQLLE